MAFNWGQRSIAVREELHPDLQLVLDTYMQEGVVDIGLSKGYRSTEEQMEEFKKGTTTIDGVHKRSMHNYKPSLAVDVYVYIPGRPDLAYNKTYLSYLGIHICGIGARLFAEGKISKSIIWGYNWDGDKDLGTDQTFQDMPHFQVGFTLKMQ